MYHAPIAEITHSLLKASGLEKPLAEQLFDDLSADIVEAILAEAGKFTSERIEPLRILSDRQGAVFKEGHVTTTPGWKELYRDWAAGGWNSLTGTRDYGGQGLPMLCLAAARSVLEQK